MNFTIVYIIFKTLIVGDPVQGYPTLMVTILFLGGIVEMSLGILGEYIANIYLETKDRPIYITKESNIEDVK